MRPQGGSAGRVWLGAIGGLLLGAIASGCAQRLRALPYDVSGVESASEPAHPLTLAVVRFRDARRAVEAPDRKGLFVYRGREYRGTVLERLGLDPLAEVTVAVARHLAKARVFAQVVVTADPAQAQDADLVLTGRLVRLRGYVEANAPEEESGRGPNEREVLAEVLLSDLVFRDDVDQPPLARFDVGWSFHDVRSQKPSPPDPYAIAAEALRPAVEQLVDAARRARLDGFVRVRSVRLSDKELPVLRGAASPEAVAHDLSALSPAGWAFSLSSTAATPAGWRSGAVCSAAAWKAQQEHGFHRMIGPFVPALEVWWCEEHVGLEWDARAEFPARYLGTDGGRRRWFARQLGRSSLQDGPSDFADRADLSPPAARYLFRLGPGPVEAGPDGPRRRPKRF